MVVLRLQVQTSRVFPGTQPARDTMWQERDTFSGTCLNYVLSSVFLSTRAWTDGQMFSQMYIHIFTFDITIFYSEDLSEKITFNNMSSLR